MCASQPVDTATEIGALRTFYDESGSYLDDLEADELFSAAPTISDWSPAQHLYHIWRANASMLKAARVLADGRVETQAPELSDVGRRVLSEGTIPRGVAQAPDSVRPPDAIDHEALRETWRRSRQKLEAVADAAADIASAEGGLPHPLWGTLTAAQWLRAAHVHSDHHAQIIADILGRRTK